MHPWPRPHVEHGLLCARSPCSCLSPLPDSLAAPVLFLVCPLLTQAACSTRPSPEHCLVLRLFDSTCPPAWTAECKCHQQLSSCPVRRTISANVRFRSIRRGTCSDVDTMYLSARLMYITTSCRRTRSCIAIATTWPLHLLE